MQSAWTARTAFPSHRVRTVGRGKNATRIEEYMFDKAVVSAICECLKQAPLSRVGTGDEPRTRFEPQKYNYSNYAAISVPNGRSRSACFSQISFFGSANSGR
jgi:hypothetical protein